jgi:hypothetical protein
MSFTGFKLCETIESEFIEENKSGSNCHKTSNCFDSPSFSSPFSSSLGFVVEAKWCCGISSSLKSILGILYSSGVLRLWNVQNNEKRDFALYMRSASTSISNQDEDESDMPTLSSEGHRRALAAHITHFDFLPFPSRRRVEKSEETSSPVFIDVPSIVFSTAKSASLLMIAEVPIHFSSPATSALSAAPLSDRTDDLANTRFRNGGLAYTCLARSNSDVTCIRSWLVADARSGNVNNNEQANINSNTGNEYDRLDLACVVVGCSDGSLHVWASGRSLNPETPVASRNPAISPRIVKVRSFTGGHINGDTKDTYKQTSYDIMDDTNEPVSVSPSNSSSPLSVAIVKGDHAHSSRIRAITSLPVKQLDNDSIFSSSLSSSSSTLSSLPSFFDSNNVFSTSSDDGTVKLWALMRTNDIGSNNSLSTSLSVSLSVQQLSVLPTDGVSVTALSGTAWPWHLGNGEDFHKTLVPNSSRAFLATGSREGFIAVYEVIIPNHIRNLNEPFLNDDDDDDDDEQTNEISSSTMHRSTRQNDKSFSLASRPSCRLTALAGPPVRALEPICDISISSPLGTSNSVHHKHYVLAAASADGLLTFYDLVGSGSLIRQPLAGDPVSNADLSSGRAPSLSLHLRSTVSSTTSTSSNSTNKNDTSLPPFCVGTSSNSMTAYDAVLQMGSEEANELRILALEEAEDNNNHENNDSLLRARLYANVSSTKRVVTALSSHALDSLSRAFLSCSFNDAARSLKGYQSSDTLDDTSFTIEGALMACTGGGDLLVWPRNQLPSDDMQSSIRISNRRQIKEINETEHIHPSLPPPSSPLPKDSLPSKFPFEGRLDTEARKEYQEDAFSSEPPEPRAPLHRAPVLSSSSFQQNQSSSQTVSSSRSTIMPSSSSSSPVLPPPPPPSPPPSPFPRVLSQTVASRARLSEVAQTLRSVREQHQKITVLRAKSPARSLLKIAAKDAVKSVYSSNINHNRRSSPSRSSLRGVTKSPVERAHRRLSRSLGVNIGTAATAELSKDEGGSSFENSFDDNNKSRSRSHSNSNSRSSSRMKGLSIRDPSIPTLAERAAAAAAAAAAASTSSDDINETRGHNTSSSSSHIVDGSFMSWAGLKGLSVNGEGRLVRLGGRTVPLDATVTVAASSATVTANNTLIVDDTYYEENEEDLPPQPRSSSSLPSSPILSQSQVVTNEICRKSSSSRYIAPIFRSPARLSASLARAARIEERAEALDSMSLALSTAAAAAGKSSNDIPSLPVVDDHADNAASLGHTNVVAPVLGSSAAMAFEIARLEQAQFDEEAAVRDALNRRRITDAVVVRTLVERARIRSLGIELPKVTIEPLISRTEKLSDAIDLPINAHLYSDTIINRNEWNKVDNTQDIDNRLHQDDGNDDDDDDDDNAAEDDGNEENRIKGHSIFLPMGGSPTTFSRQRKTSKGILKNTSSIAATDILQWGKGLRSNNNTIFVPIHSTVSQKLKTTTTTTTTTTTKTTSVNESQAETYTNDNVKSNTSNQRMVNLTAGRPLLVSVGGVIQSHSSK